MIDTHHIKNQIKFYVKKYGFFKTVWKCITVGSRKVIRILKGERDVNYGDYGDWIHGNEVRDWEIKAQYKKKFKIMPKISLVVPMYNTKEKFLKELVDSLIKQTYSNWELCLADRKPKAKRQIKKNFRKR